MEKVSILVTESGMEHMRSVFEAERKSAEKEVEEIDSILSLMERLASNVSLIVEDSDGNLERVNLSFKQSDVIFRALESRRIEESDRADRLAEAYAECDTALNNAKEGSK